MNVRRRPRAVWILMAILPVASACDSCTGPETVGSISLGPPSLELTVGDELQLLATVASWTGSILPGHPVSWRSSRPQVASVTPSGWVTAQAVGTSTVTAESGGQSASTSSP